MRTTKRTKTRRIDLRCSPDERARLFSEAQRRGVSVTRLLLAAALAQCEETERDKN